MPALKSALIAFINVIKEIVIAFCIFARNRPWMWNQFLMMSRLPFLGAILRKVYTRIRPYVLADQETQKAQNQDIAPGWLCPECGSILAGATEERYCPACRWRQGTVERINVFLSAADKLDTEGYHVNYAEIACDDLDKSIVPESYLQKLAEQLAAKLPLGENANICDIGSGKGYLLKALRNRGVKELTAVDISLDYLRMLQNDFDCVLANAENLPFKNQFTHITATDVMEHVLNLGNFLFCVNRALLPDGYFALRVPYNENLLAYSKYFSCKYKYVHLRSFTRTNLVRNISEAGFDIIDIKYCAYTTLTPGRYTFRSKILQLFYDTLYDLIFESTGELMSRGEPGFYKAKLLTRPLEIFILAQKRHTLKSTCS